MHLSIKPLIKTQIKAKSIAICLLVLLGTSCQEQPSDLDAILLQCYDLKYQEAGYDIRSIIDTYEKALIKGGSLRDGSGKSYLEAMQKIASDKDFRIQAAKFQEYDPWHKVAKETGVAVFECEYEMIESLKQTDSKWQKVFGTSESPDQMYQAMVENLSENDLNSYYFKLKMFQVFDGVNSQWRNPSTVPSDATDE